MQSVRESGSFMALEMRAKIRELIVAGRTDEEVLDYFVARYGDFILLEPRKRGFGLAAYVLPLAAVLVGALLLAARGRRARPAGRASSAEGGAAPARGDLPTPGEVGPLSSAELERVERELQRYTS